MRYKSTKYDLKTSRQFIEPAVTATIAVVLFVLASIFDAFETIAEWSQRYEQLRLNESAILALTLAFALAIFSLHRWKELRREVTERERIERELETLNRKLEATVEKLALSNRDLQDFVHMTAHDLKSPLRAIGTLADWLSADYGDKFDEAGQEQIKLLVGRTERMSKLVDGILQYSEVGRLEQKVEEVDLNTLLTEVIYEINPSENIEITVENKLPTVICERTGMMQIFENLLNNAVKHIDKPELQIRVGCIEEQDFWKFSVADNGPGIEEKYFEKIFKMFQTLLPRDEIESTGVGLAVTKKIIEVYGGKIWVESKIGNGSTFFFTFPKAHSVAKNDKQLSYPAVEWDSG